ncbi:alpha/beta fold hydrolase [Aquimarina sp. AU474]|uniref:alpha/beta hydrolase family protein n=1 Tax=Aquimarina sp. AU474 TaxID=2108529 RepID=UPI000D6A0033|nr:alpha/beta fold hydrolase [Aquimarina sp. AU474]
MINIRTKDGYLLSANMYLASASIPKNKVLIINSATAVSKTLYHHYATLMSKKGYNVITYDYRGIADSRPKRLRGFKTTFLEWGQHDFSAIIDYAKITFVDDKIIVLGHSIGGTIIGMTEKNKDISGIITIGAQTAYYKDWSKKHKTKIYIIWHMILPMITTVVGYFPGKRLRMLEDVPKGVIKQWHSRRHHENMKTQLETKGVQFFYHTCTAKLLTLGIEDDPIGTEIAIKRIHDFFEQSDKKLEMIKLADVPTQKIGHFGFFSRKFKDTLWVKTLDWFDSI